MNEFLSATELHQLTGFARATGQAVWLKEKGVPHRLDGRRVIVARTHALAWLEGKVVVSGGVNLSAVR